MIDTFIADLEFLAKEIDDVLPNGRASRHCHALLGVWKARRGTAMDLADPDVIKRKVAEK